MTANYLTVSCIVLCRMFLIVDELPAFLMKQCSKLFIKPLCHVLSLSIRQGVFPIELKLAKVLPIYKSDDKRQLKNYRPISVLPFILQ